MENMVAQLPISCCNLKHARFSESTHWRLRDLSLSSNGEIVLCGGNERTKETYIDVFSIPFNFSHKPKLRYSKLFSKSSSGSFSSYVRRVSVVQNDNDKIVTCIGDTLEVIALSEEAVVNSRKLKGTAMCLSVSDFRILVGFYQSKKINIYDLGELNEIKSISLKGIQSGNFPFEITATCDKLFICVGQLGRESIHCPLLFEESSGRILTEFTHPTGSAWYAWGLTVSEKLGTVAVVWSDSFHAGEGQWQVVFYSMNGTNQSFLIVGIESGVSIVGISDRADLMVTRNYVTGDVRMYAMAEVYSYLYLKKRLSTFLTTDECRRLITHFSLGDNHRDMIMRSDTPVEALLLVLEKEGYARQWDVDRLAEAFVTDLPSNSICAHATTVYQRTRSVTFYKEEIKRMDEKFKTESLTSRRTIKQLTNNLGTANTKAEDQKRANEDLSSKLRYICQQLSHKDEELKEQRNVHKEREQVLQETERKLENTLRLLESITQERDLIRTELHKRKHMESLKMEASRTLAEGSLAHGTVVEDSKTQIKSPYVSTNSSLGHGVFFCRKEPEQNEANDRQYYRVDNPPSLNQHQRSFQNDMELTSRMTTIPDLTMLIPKETHTPGPCNTLHYYNYTQYVNNALHDKEQKEARNMYDIIGNDDGNQKNPFRHRLVRSLAKKLDPHDVLGNNWERLADELGFTTEDIEFFRSLERSSTVLVIDCAVKQGKLTSLSQLKSILEKIKRRDVSSIIPDEEMRN